MGPSINRFLATLPPMLQGRSRKALGVVLSRNGVLDTRAGWIDRFVTEGWRVETVRRVDTREQRRLQEYIDRARITVPFGNVRHPDTIRYNEARELLRSGPMADQRRLVAPTGSFLEEADLTKTAIDYAVFILSERT